MAHQRSRSVGAVGWRAVGRGRPPPPSPSPPLPPPILHATLPFLDYGGGIVVERELTDAASSSSSGSRKTRTDGHTNSERSRADGRRPMAPSILRQQHSFE